MAFEPISTSFIYDNPLPQLESINSCFPFAAELEDGTLLASHTLGQAFESVDNTTWLSKSTDKGLTWELLCAPYDKSKQPVRTSDFLKITNLGHGHLMLFGYEYFRNDPKLPLGNPKTGGVLDNRIVKLTSEDGGKTWSDAVPIPCRWGYHAEASAPVTILKNGDYAAPIAPFADWNNQYPGPIMGRLLRSSDKGETWNDDAILGQFPEGDVMLGEQRICELQSGTLIDIQWNENVKTGKRLENHFSYSTDGGKTFTGPIPTGIMGQASGLVAIEGERFLAIHAIRRDTDKPGIYGYVINFKNRKWEIEESAPIWMPKLPILKDEKMPEIFSFLKFGQPGGIRLHDGSILMTHWIIEEGQGKTVATRIRIS